MTSSRYATIPFEPYHATMLGAATAHFAHLGPLTQGHEAVTLWHQDEERPLACGGLLTIWPGLGYAWHIIGADAHEHPQAIGRYALRWLRPRMQTFLRVEALVREDDSVVRHFAAWLGFAEVLVKPGYGQQGETYIELAWVREEA